MLGFTNISWCHTVLLPHLQYRFAVLLKLHFYFIVLQSYSFIQLLQTPGSNSLFVCTNVVNKVDSDNMRPIIQWETFHLGCQLSIPVCPVCVTMLEMGEMGEQKGTTLLCPLMSSFHTDHLKLWRHDMQFVYLKAWGTIVLSRSLMILKCQFPFSIYLWNFFGMFLLQFFCRAFPATK